MADFTTTDPLGNEITLRDDTWYSHILGRHRELAPYRGDVELALQRPVTYEPSRMDPNRMLYIRPLTDDASHQVVVVADIVEGAVTTAYLERARKGARRHGRDRTRN